MYEGYRKISNDLKTFSIPYQNSVFNTQYSVLNFLIPFIHFRYPPNISDTILTFLMPSGYFPYPIETQCLVF